jgi:hypothetical protein
MRRVFTTRNYFLGFLFLLLVIVLSVFYITIGILAIAVVFVAAILLYVVHGIASLFHAMKRRIK